jgi:hypothetical protein
VSSRQPDSGLEQGMDPPPPIEGGLGELPRRSPVAGARHALWAATLLARGVAQAVPRMPPVGDVDRVRQRVARGLRTGRRTVAAHDLDSRTRPQPIGHHLGAAAGQHVDPGAGVGVDHHSGAVMMPAQGEIVDPQHLRHRAIR